ncbi:hypothetical protein DW992_04415 [Bacteroides stercoris]|nr:hypothetical protein DW992_04415 [Bacteroides stercoris]
MKHFVNSANVGIKFRTGVPFFAENHCNLNNIFYFHSSKHFPFGNKPINGSVFANISFSLQTRGKCRIYFSENNT